MLGEFHEYDDAFSFGEPTRITSLAQRNRLEREHGLYATSPNDPRLSVNEIARRELRHEQSRPENVRAREAAIRDALQRQRR